MTDASRRALETRSPLPPLQPRLPRPLASHEAWRRIPQVLENVFAQDANAAVRILRDTHQATYPLSCRNLVTSLIQHEQIKTTLPKARDAARLAEKV